MIIVITFPCFYEMVKVIDYNIDNYITAEIRAVN